MKQTVVGVFDRYETAQQAAARLAERGFPSEAVRVTETQPGDLDHDLSDTSAAPRYGEHRGVMESIRGFFAEVFGTDHETHESHPHLSEYAEAVRRGGAVVRVDAEDDPHVDTAREVLQDAGALDIEEKAAEWRAGGWNPEMHESDFARVRDEGALGTNADPGTSMLAGEIPTTDGTGLDTRGATRTLSPGSVGQPEDSVGMRAASSSTTDLDDRSRSGSTRVGEDVIPVLKEELEVGKRTVAKGGVRVYSHVVERPVQETLDLREERAKVERRPVDRPASEADLRAFQERTVEVRETAETPVVKKTAKVVEEVAVGKESTRRRETVSDTVRSTEVEVDRLGTEGSTTSASRAFEDDADLYRADWQQNYASQGGTFEDYEPAYRYGHGLAGESRYAGRSWEAIEQDARSDWERANPGSAWERVKAAVRHAWERMKPGP